MGDNRWDAMEPAFTRVFGSHAADIIRMLKDMPSSAPTSQNVVVTGGGGGGGGGTSSGGGGTTSGGVTTPDGSPSSFSSPPPIAIPGAGIGSLVRVAGGVAVVASCNASPANLATHVVKDLIGGLCILAVPGECVPVKCSSAGTDFNGILYLSTYGAVTDIYGDLVYSDGSRKANINAVQFIGTRHPGVASPAGTVMCNFFPSPNST